MGTECLLDLLAERLRAGGANVIKIKCKGNITRLPRSFAAPGVRRHVIVYDISLYDIALRSFPDSEVYGARELCRQMPVCFKRPADADITEHPEYDCVIV